jgi:hypothetical protein
MALLIFASIKRAEVGSATAKWGACAAGCVAAYAVAVGQNTANRAWVMERLSLELMQALACGEGMDQGLMAEWQRKRPEAYREHKRRVIAAALGAVHNKPMGANMVLHTEV